MRASCGRVPNFVSCPLSRVGRHRLVTTDNRLLAAPPFGVYRTSEK